MGQASEMYIEHQNMLYETDEDYRRACDEQMAIDAAEEAEWFERELEMEKLEDFFPDKLIDVKGLPVELPPTETVVLIDDDIPF